MFAASKNRLTELGVMNFPRKSAKKKVPEETFTVLIVSSPSTEGKQVLAQPVLGQLIDKQYLIEQRPQTGLLANLWQFPQCPWTPGQSMTEVLRCI